MTTLSPFAETVLRAYGQADFIEPETADSEYHATVAELVTGGYLVEVDPPDRGVWKLTGYGRRRLAALWAAEAPKPDMVRVPVNLVIEVDANAWRNTYGTEPGRKALVENVRSYFLNQAQCSTAIDECDGTVTLKR